MLTRVRKFPKSKEKALGVQPKIEEPEAAGSNILATIPESGSQSSDDSFNQKPVLQLITHDTTPNSPFSYGWPIGLFSYEDDESPTSPVGPEDISPNIRALQYYPFREHIRKSYHGVSKMHVGSVALEPMHALPFEPSLRNAQLLHFCQYPSQSIKTIPDICSPSKAGSFHVVN
jgi:hypothetical protein